MFRRSSGTSSENDIARLVRLAVLGLALTLIVLCVCSIMGRYPWSAGGMSEILSGTIFESPIWRTRVFRLLAAAIVGAALAVAGTSLQAILRNPLAEPYVLGLSSGSGVGVLVGSLLAQAGLLPGWAGGFSLALIGAAATAVVVFIVAQRNGRLDPYVLLLTGVIANMFNGAVCLLLLQFVDQEGVVLFVGWGMGRIPEHLWFHLGLLYFSTFVLFTGWGLILLRGAAYNVLSLGEDTAVRCGVATKRLRIESYIVVSALTAAAVTLAGPIGFVGLIVPHACRMIVGPEHRSLALISGFAGAVFLMSADTTCRLLGEAFQIGELPVGVVTAMIGGPFFLYILRRRMGEVSL